MRLRTRVRSPVSRPSATFRQMVRMWRASCRTPGSLVWSRTIVSRAPRVNRSGVEVKPADSFSAGTRWDVAIAIFSDSV